MKICLNLLPEERKKELERKKMFRTIIWREVVFLFPIVVFAVILLDIYIILGIQKENMVLFGSQEQSQGQYKELHAYEDKFKQTNELAISISRIQKEHLYWSHLIRKISEITPEGVFLNDFSTKDYQAFLLGRAKNREDLLAFKDAVANSGCADSVNVPLSNLVTKDNIDFQMDFVVKPECIKDKNK